MEFANALAKQGEDIHIVCFEDKEDEYFPDLKITRHQLNNSFMEKIPKLRVLFNIMYSAIQLRRIKSDVVISFCLPMDYNMRIWLATWFSRTSFVYAVRNNLEKVYPDKKGSHKWKRICFLADRIWIQTEGQRIFFPNKMQEKIFRIPNLMNPCFLKIPRKTRTCIRHFISAGRIHQQKNQKLLIQAFAKMLATTGEQHATLTIYGRAQPNANKLEQELNMLIRECHLEGNVFLAGRVSNIEQKYEEADAFVFGSDHEGCPNALMEAMAAGLPCISTDCPTGPSDLITTGKNGLLVPVGNVEAMALAMQYLLEHPQDANQMGMAAKQRMREWGTPEEITRQLLCELEKIRS